MLFVVCFVVASLVGPSDTLTVFVAARVKSGKRLVVAVAISVTG